MGEMISSKGLKTNDTILAITPTLVPAILFFSLLRYALLIIPVLDVNMIGMIGVTVHHPVSRVYLFQSTAYLTNVLQGMED